MVMGSDPIQLVCIAVVLWSRAKLPERNDVRAQGMHEEQSVDIQALFGLSVLMSFVAFGLVTKLYPWPRLRIAERDDALVASRNEHGAW